MGAVPVPKATDRPAHLGSDAAACLDDTHATDGELVRHALAGQSWAFGELLARHLERVHRLIARRLRKPEDVLDVLQDTTLTLWRALGSYDANRPFEAWMTCIALNKCKDWARRGAVRTRLLLHAREHAEQCSPALQAPGPEKLLIDREDAQDLQRALELLPFKLREPLILTAIHELSHAEAGQALGLTSKAVENRVRRARQMLAQGMRTTGDP
jgi:RNA polymerase sigma factor CnrH